jgi:cytochrome c
MKDPAQEMAPADNTAETKEPTPSTETEKATDGMADQVLSHDEGLALAKKSGCLACHKIEAKLVGPAWRDVSKRYKGDPDAGARLVAKVKAGGKGNWTDVTGGVSMPPYSPRVSDEDIERLVTFVLSQ